jgi:hypothetical protein
MVSRKTLLIVSLLLVLGVAIFFFLRKGENDRKKIKEKLHQLAEIVSITPGKNRKSFIIMMGEVKKVINSPCELDIDGGGLSGSYPPQKIACLTEQFQANITNARLSFYDIKIQFPMENSAIINCTGRLKGLTRRGERFDEFRELQVKAVKTGGKWRLSRFQTIEALEK